MAYLVLPLEQAVWALLRSKLHSAESGHGISVVVSHATYPRFFFVTTD
jgi:hypothetical protein